MPCKRNSDVGNKVPQVAVLKHRLARPALTARLNRPFHKFFQPLAFERGNFHNGYTEPLFKLFRVDLIALLIDDVNHIQRNHDRYVYFENLRR